MPSFLSKNLKAASESLAKRKEPLWKGPEVDGITFSLLSRFLVCRERFRLLVMEGLKTNTGFDHKTGFGDMWHVCEESLAKDKGGKGSWEPLIQHCRQQCREYPTQQLQVDKWYNVCKVQFPVYVDYWRKHPDVQKRTPIFQEQEFGVPYKLPSGRIVKLRGKWDAVDLINGGIWIQENKTKGQVIEEGLKRQLKFDLQTMIYVVALYEDQKEDMTSHLSAAADKTTGNLLKTPIKGVRYNVIRRPLSGGKGTIKQGEGTEGSKCPKCKGTPGNAGCIKCYGRGRVGGKPPETNAEFYGRVGQYIADEPETYFWRWNVPVLPNEVTKFKNQCLNPILENLCGWWEYVTTGKNSLAHLMPMNWRHPFGVYNSLDEGGASDLDEYLDTGSMVGLRRVDTLFPELKHEKKHG